MLDADVKVALGTLDLDAHIVAEGGRTVALLGPNGAGKTTMLRALAGLVAIDRGRISLDDRVLDDPAAGIFVEPQDRSAALVFQDHVLFPHLSVLDNVAFGLEARGMRRRDARERAREALSGVGIAEMAMSRPRELSGGQAQRAALARALVTEPHLLLLDEPLAALDATVRVQTRRDLVRRLRDQHGVRIVVTHDPIEAAILADELIVLEHGSVVQRGTPGEIAARPRSRYVGDLVGVNVFAGVARHGTIEIDGTVVIAADDVDGDVFAVVHPRAVVLHLGRPEGSSRNVWASTVTDVDDEGDRVRVRLAGPLPLVAEVTPAGAQALRLAPGVTVWAAVKATEVSVFPS